MVTTSFGPGFGFGPGGRGEEPGQHRTHRREDLARVARDVTGDDHLGAEPQPREEHLHLRRRRVLSFIENDECLVKGVVRDQEVRRHVEMIFAVDEDALARLLARRA